MDSDDIRKQYLMDQNLSKTCAWMMGFLVVSLFAALSLRAQDEVPAVSGEIRPQIPRKVKPLTSTETKAPVKRAYGRPALVEIKDLADFDSLSSDRKKLIEVAIATARDSPWLPYAFGKADPSQGGFDCSGAMYFVMNKAGLKPPRSSAAQYAWLLDAKRMNVVAVEAVDYDHPSLKALKPGDLLFWSTGEVVAGVKALSITHVALYLGREKKDGLRIMINATDGRSYRGVKANGYGVYDFRVPAKDARSRLVGYGTPPGLTVATVGPAKE
jgi:cell wall-associated NlpC family hydrolase